MKGFTLVLGGGAARGLAHLGVLRALEEMGLKPKRIVGCSMGALVGAVYCVREDLDRMEEIAFSLSKRKVAELFRPVPTLTALTDGIKIINFLKPLLGDTKAEDLRINFGAVAVDLETGNEVFLKRGPLSIIVRASISVPGVFTPVHLDGRLLVDGGVVDPLPTKAAKLRSRDPIISVNVLTKIKPDFEVFENNMEHCLQNPRDCLRRSRGLNLFQILIQAMALEQSGLIKENLELYPPDILIEPDVEFIKMHEFYRAREAFEAGYRAALDMKEKIFNLLA